MKLYIIHVGFYDNEIGIYELHSNILIVASDAKSAKQAAKNNDLFIKKNMHIDGIQEIVNVDGYNITVTKSNEPAQINYAFSYDQIKEL